MRFHPLMFSTFAFLVTFLISISAVGMEYYKKVVPYYDSMGYQMQFVSMIDRYRTDGYFSNYLSFFNRVRTTFWNDLLTTVFAPLLPRNTVGLYIISFATLLLVLIALWLLVCRLCDSEWWASATVLFAISIGLGSAHLGGLVDQRIDYIAAQVFASTVVALITYVKYPDERRVLNLFLVLLSLCILYRPISVSQLFFVFIAILLTNLKNISKVISNIVRSKLAWMLLMFCFVVIFPSISWIYTYYFIENSDFGVKHTIYDSLIYIVSSILQISGKRWLMINLVLLLFVFYVNWKDALFILLLFFLSLFPFIIGGVSTNPYVLYPSSLLLILIFIQANKILNSRVSVILVSILVLSNFFIQSVMLSNNIKYISPAQRESVDGIYRKLNSEYDSSRYYISGTSTLAQSIISIDSLYGSNRADEGSLFYHSKSFGLDNDSSSEVIENAMAKKISEVCGKEGYFIVLDHELPCEDCIFTEKYGRLLNNAISKNDCLKLHTNYLISGRKYNIYLVK